MLAYKKNPIRLISVAVAACFLLQEAAWAAPVASAGSPLAVPPPMAISQFVTNPSQIQMPLEHVMVQEIHAGTNGKLIIHIQDAHANLSGQQSLTKALDQLLTKYDLRLVLVEGSARDSSLDEIRKLAPLKEWSIIARRFLYEGIISGEEYLNLTTEHPMKIIGVEYRDLYDEAVKAYAAIVDRRKDILHYLYQAKISLDRLKVKMYPKELKDYEAGRAFDDSGSVDFKNGFSSLLKLAKLADYPLADLPQVGKLQELMDKESSIAFDKANAEQAEVLKGLGERGAVDEAKEFVEASRRTRFSQVSQYMLLSKLMQTAEQKQMALESFPELKAYTEYLSKFTELKVDDLMSQMEYLEDKVYEKLLPDDNARKIRAIDRFIGLLGNAYKLQMSSRDFNMFTFNEKDFKTESWLAFMNRQLVDLGFFESLVPYKPYLEEARADFGRFYQLVSERDGAFVENAKRIMDEQHENAAVLIAGGYHTAHLTELLRAEGTSYIVLTPVVTDTTDHDRYEDLLLSHLKEQEKHLAATHTGKKDTAPYRAQNVATTKIPRGLRNLEALGARFAQPLDRATTAFVTSRMTKLPDEIIQAARLSVSQRLEVQRPSAARMAEVDINILNAILESWGQLNAGHRPGLRESAVTMPGFRFAHTEIINSSSPVYQAFQSVPKGEMARRVLVDWIETHPFLKKYYDKLGLIGALENAFQHGRGAGFRIMVGMVKTTTDIWGMVADTGNGMDIQRALAGERDLVLGNQGLGLTISIDDALRLEGTVLMASGGSKYEWGNFKWKPTEGYSRPAPDVTPLTSSTKGVLWAAQIPIPAAARMAVDPDHAASQLGEAKKLTEEILAEIEPNLASIQSAYDHIASAKDAAVDEAQLEVIRGAADRISQGILRRASATTSLEESGRRVMLNTISVDGIPGNLNLVKSAGDISTLAGGMIDGALHEASSRSGQPLKSEAAAHLLEPGYDQLKQITAALVTFVFQGTASQAIHRNVYYYKITDRTGETAAARMAKIQAPDDLPQNKHDNHVIRVSTADIEQAVSLAETIIPNHLKLMDYSEGFKYPRNLPMFAHQEGPAVLHHLAAMLKVLKNPGEFRRAEGEQAIHEWFKDTQDISPDSLAVLQHANNRNFFEQFIFLHDIGKLEQHQTGAVAEVEDGKDGNYKGHEDVSVQMMLDDPSLAASLGDRRGMLIEVVRHHGALYGIKGADTGSVSDEAFTEFIGTIDLANVGGREKLNEFMPLAIAAAYLDTNGFYFHDGSNFQDRVRVVEAAYDRWRQASTGLGSEEPQGIGGSLGSRSLLTGPALPSEVTGDQGKGIEKLLPAGVTAQLAGAVLPVALADTTGYVRLEIADRAESPALFAGTEHVRSADLSANMTEFSAILSRLLGAKGIVQTQNPPTTVHVILADGFLENETMPGFESNQEQVRALAKQGDAVWVVGGKADFGNAVLKNNDQLAGDMFDTAQKNVIYNIIGTVDAIRAFHQKMSATPGLLGQTVRAPIRNGEDGAEVADIAGAFLIGKVLAPIKSAYNAALESDKTDKALANARDLKSALNPRVGSALNQSRALLFSEQEGIVFETDYFDMLSNAALRPFKDLRELLAQVAQAVRMVQTAA